MSWLGSGKLFGIKSKLKRVLNQGIVDSEEIIRRISEYESVSFDLFDTLIKRNVDKPTDLFILMEEQGHFSGFYKNRIIAEQIARRTSKYEEVTLDEIYQQSGMGAKEKEYELELEKEAVTLNSAILPVYKYCVETGKKIYIVSDTYFSREYIEGILTNLGIDRYDALYLSSDVRKTKRTGELYKYLLRREGLNKDDIIHIGDSKYSDYDVPKKIGICSVHIPTWNRNAVFVDNKASIKMNYLTTFINNRVARYEDIYEKFGYECFGPFLWGYTKWLFDRCKMEGISKIFFFSRDGYIMKKCFEIIDSDKEFDTKYLEVSRRSLRVPILQFDNTLEALIDTISPSKMVSLKAIFDGCGLDIDAYEKIILEYGFNNDSVFDRSNILEDDKLKKLYDRISEYIEKVSMKEYAYLKEYLNDNNVSGRFAVVDIGWAGGMQRYMMQVLEKMGVDAQVTGFYTGVAEYYKRNTKVNKNLELNGYLFDFSHDGNSVDKRSSFVGLFESLFLEQGGSVKNYVESEGRVAAIRYPYEYCIDGEEATECKKIRMIQNAAIEFVSDATEDGLLNKFEYTSDELFAGIYNVGTNPGKRELDMFADFRFFDEGETNKLAAPESLFKYILNPMKAKRDFLQARWKIGFMKRLFKVRLPYYRMYTAMLRLK